MEKLICPECNTGNVRMHLDALTGVVDVRLRANARGEITIAITDSRLSVDRKATLKDTNSFESAWCEGCGFEGIVADFIK